MQLASPKHILTGEELGADELLNLLALAEQLKATRQQPNASPPLAGKHLALIFDKPSLRTRFSFTVAMRELGGDVIESTGDSRKAELPEDQMRVLQGYCDAVMVRTFEDSTLQAMQKVATIPIINGLSDRYHPCQIFADLLTLKERFGTLSGLTLSYIGDGNNILHSLLTLATQVGVSVHYCCPPGRGPNAMILKRATNGRASGKIQAFETPAQAVQHAQAIYTDVWTSMGFETADDTVFQGFQINETLMSLADREAVFMHCMPMVRGKEVSQTLPDTKASVIFQQSENRLHAQKALLLTLLG